MSTAARAQDAEALLYEEVATYYSDPLGFVLAMYPWGEPGPLERHEGPDVWQREFLIWLGEQIRERGFDGSKPVLPIRRAVSSGHGIGKSTEVAFLVNFLMSTRPHAQGTVTANSWDQLNTKTWAAIRKWTQLCLTSHWFDVTTAQVRHRDHPATWFCSAQSSKEENSEAFAGQHAESSTSFYVFDEDSGISEKIHEVAEGGLTDGEPMIFLFGNCTRNSGHFYQACFGAQRDRWNPQVIDSRTSRFTNNAVIEEWIETYGEDSDFVRVRVLGLPPRASELQFIDQERVYQAQKRAVVGLPDEPLIAGLDVSDGGSAWNVLRFRRGMDARSIPPVRIPGEAVRSDRSMLLAKLSEVLSESYDGQQVAMMFVDSAFGAPYVERLRAMGYANVQEVRFGGDSPDAHYKNQRAYMWGKMKEWLMVGAVDEKDSRLESDLTGPGYALDPRDKLVIESKESMAKRGVASPDDGDALALTFAANVSRGTRKRGPVPRMPTSWAGV